MLGNVKFVTKDPVEKIPEVFYVGGFTSKDAQGNDIYYDWLQYEESYEELPDGRIEIDFSLRYFDNDFVKDSNERLTVALTSEYLTSLELTEIHYEVFEDKGMKNHVPLILKEFSIMDPLQKKTYSYKNVDGYNKNYSQ